MFDRAEETPGAKRTVTHAGLPPLSGAAELAQQAEEIRMRILVEADDVLSRLRSDATQTVSEADTGPLTERHVTHDQVVSAQRALAHLRAETSSAWWIANESSSAGELLSNLMIAAVDRNQP